jgi:hypothetical protein
MRYPIPKRHGPGEFLLIAIAIWFFLPTSWAVEGMWTPEQLPDIEDQLADAGLRIRAKDLSDLTGFPLGAVISLGGCTASFISPEGLVVTNHHCARGSVQFNSRENNNYLVKGFVSRSRTDELRAAPGTRVYVSTRFEDVTNKVRLAADAQSAPRERYQAIEDATKSLIRQCETKTGVRCQVASYYGGAVYKLVERLEIRDIRLVYAPGDNIGTYGGDIDNWTWPRHTGDFALYRAYVGPDGKPADYSEDNVPYEPTHFLKVSSAGLGDGHFVMAAGYPGSTRRYARLSEVEHTFGWLYPTYKSVLGDWIEAIEGAAPPGSDIRIKYESRLAGLNNLLKNLGGQLDGAERVGLTDRRAAREKALAHWANANPSRAIHAEAFDKMDKLVDEMNADARKDFWYNRVTSSQLLRAAQRLYRLAKEREKPDIEREPGYQERDMTFFRERMRVIERRFDSVVDKAEWLTFLGAYMNQPVNQRVTAFDHALGLDIVDDRDSLGAHLDSVYESTGLNDIKTRLAWMERPAADFQTSDDSFIQLAVALYDHDLADEEQDKTFEGRMSQLRPSYMAALIDYNESLGQAVYPDANGTLRVTYGKVVGGSPKDGLIYEPFTRLNGILEKNTGRAPFDAPKRQLELIAAKDYGLYALEELGSVPVNFLSDLDSTGGNSGSATLDANGNLVGLLFDGTIESVNSDWDFDPRTTRSIHVDTRYMLWVMEKVDDATHLIDEMTLVRTR